MLRCLTKSKIDCSFQNNEFRFKNRGFTQFFFWFSFFFSFLRSTLDEITKRYVKNYGGVFEKKRKKRRKNTVLMEKRKKLEKKRPGRDSNPRSSVSNNREFESPANTRPTPYHLATEPQRMLTGGIRIIECNNHNALCTPVVTAQQHYYSST